MPATRILIPLDGSELAEAALPFAERIGRALGLGAILLRVVSPSVAHQRPVGHGVAPIEAPLTEETVDPAGYEAIRHEEAAAMEMAAPVERLRAAGLDVEPEVGVGNPAEVIAERAHDEDVALIVMASHGRTGLARLLRGSVASAVVDQTKRPVLVVRPFRDIHSRVDLEHAENLPADQVERLQQALADLEG